jgi:peptidoglycan hydrolase-like protein with peptidoglycan-binding domain
MNRRALLPLTAAAVAALVGVAVWAFPGAESGSATTESSDPTATATVERRDLVQRETVTGTLGYADATTLYAQGQGTVTALREPGSIVTRGQALYWLDGKPVTLMYGKVPMWRRLNAGASDGPDVEQLERNLVALGYDPDGEIEIDDDWGSATTAAVKRWQDDKELPETGSVEPGQVVFLPGARRIGQLKTTRGAVLQPAAELFETTSTRRVATVDLEADKLSLSTVGDTVIVELPEGGSVEGTISSVSAVAESETDPETGEQTDPTIPVEIRLAPGAKTGRLDQTPVDISFEAERAKNALTVPVSALLALAEGGFAVEVVDGPGSTHLVRVEPGMYADTFVQISGDGIKKGMKVVVPE